VCGLEEYERGIAWKEGWSRTMVRRARLSVPEPAQSFAPNNPKKAGVRVSMIAG